MDNTHTVITFPCQNCGETKDVKVPKDPCTCGMTEPVRIVRSVAAGLTVVLIVVLTSVVIGQHITAGENVIKHERDTASRLQADENSSEVRKADAETLRVAIEHGVYPGDACDRCAHRRDMHAQWFGNCLPESCNCDRFLMKYPVPVPVPNHEKNDTGSR